MLKENELIGSFAVYRQEVRPFADKQIALVTNFAAQAVIAIENARLLNELRQRTSDLTESLDQQTATSEVLQVISSCPGDLEPVFATMLKEAVRICDAKSGGIYRVEDDAMRLVATHNVPSQYAEARRFSSFHPGPRHILGRVMRTKSVVQIADAATDPGYVERRPEMVAAVELGGVGTMLGVPMLKENDLLGVFALNRQEVCPFNEKQIALLTNFAAQAVIAIENARLLTELRESLQEQTATSQVLQVIAAFQAISSPCLTPCWRSRAYLRCRLRKYLPPGRWCPAPRRDT
jgi:GAF domain-containing protein